MKIEDEKNCVKVGSIYEVPCVVIKNEIMPVLGPAHADSCEIHYHFDLRFMTAAELGKNGLVIDASEVEREIRTERVCRRQTFLTVSKIEGLTEEYSGKKLRNNKCPHRGHDLSNVKVKNGCKTCPMHGLKFDSEGVVVKDREFDRQEQFADYNDLSLPGRLQDA